MSQFNGSADAPLKHVHLTNVTLAHSAYTYLEPYEIPSGGDWAIHRGAAVFADGAESVIISGNKFDQIDGNGIFLSRYARNCSIKANDMAKIGDSGILVVGASGSGMVVSAAKTRDVRGLDCQSPLTVALLAPFVSHTLCSLTGQLQEPQLPGVQCD